MTSQVTKVTCLKVFNMSKSNTDHVIDNIDEAILSSFQQHKTEIKLLFDRYTLRDTGNLINTAEVIDTDSGIAIDYTADYAPYVYHRDDITPSTPGTSSYWDDKAVESAEFSKILDRIKEDAVDTINRK